MNNSKYLQRHTKRDFFSRVWSAIALDYTFEEREIKDVVFTMDKLDISVPCKHIKLHKLESGQRTNKCINLYISDYKIFQSAEGTQPLNRDLIKKILSNLYMDDSNYLDDYKYFNTEIENKLYELEKNENHDYFMCNAGKYVEFNDAHERELEEINKGLPPYTLEISKPKSENPDSILEELFGRY